LKYLTLPKDKRLAGNCQFKAVLDYGLRAGDRWLTLYAAPNGREDPRLGVSIGRSTGNSVVRTRLKRLMREAFRLHQNQIPAGFDYVLMIAPGASRRLRRPDQRTNALAEWTGPRVQKSFLSLVDAAFRRRQEKRD